MALKRISWLREKAKGKYLLFCVAVSMAGLSSCSKTPALSDSIAIPAPGRYLANPIGISRVHGKCQGVIALTPYNALFSLKKEGAITGRSYPLLYHCNDGSFEVLPDGGFPDQQEDVADLTITENGYYFYRFKLVDFLFRGEYSVRDKNGKEQRRIARKDLDGHDLILENDRLTYLRYVPDRASASCDNVPLVEFEIVEEDFQGRVLWRWSSKNVLKAELNVSSPATEHPNVEPPWMNFIRPIRHCLTSVLGGWLELDTPSLFLLPGKWPLLKYEHNDYAHVNSIQYINADRDILVSARHLDSVFVVKRTTGTVSWALGGAKNKMTPNVPANDKRGGFSHQHSAYIGGDMLWMFDNGNNFPSLPSRAVGYGIDVENLDSAKLRYEFLEPNGKQRQFLGYVRPISKDQIIVGWGAPYAKDAKDVQRAVSIYNVTTGAEEFLMDMEPGWASYRAKYSSAEY